MEVDFIRRIFVLLVTILRHSCGFTIHQKCILFILIPGVYSQFEEHITCGKDEYYLSLLVNDDRNELFVGSKNKMFVFNTDLFINSDCKKIIKLNYTEEGLGVCKGKHPEDSEPCNNYIHDIYFINYGKNLYACGSNALVPLQYAFKLNRELDQNSVIMKNQKNNSCAYRTDKYSTNLWVENGNQAETPQTQYAANRIHNAGPAAFFQRRAFRNDKEHPFAPVLNLPNNEWLKEPRFAGSFEAGQFVYLFFHEQDSDCIECGGRASRVGRVCKMDLGSQFDKKGYETFTSFVKIRLICPVNKTIANYIHDVYKTSFKGEVIFHAIFQSKGKYDGSVLCDFTLKSVDKAFDIEAARFNKKFPEEENKYPGNCTSDSKTYKKTAIEYMQGHYDIRDVTINATNNKSIHIKTKEEFTKILARRFAISTYISTAYFIGTNNGTLYKISQIIPKKKGKAIIQLLDTKTTDGYEVKAMAYSDKLNNLYVATKTAVTRIRMDDWCRIRNPTCLECMIDPHCIYDDNIKKCRGRDNNNVGIDLCDSIKQRSKCGSQYQYSLLVIVGSAFSVIFVL